MPEDFVDIVMAQVNGAAYRALDALRPEVVAYAKQLVSTPYPPASTGGNPPHLRTGNLKDGIDGDVVGAVAGSDVTELTAWSDRAGGDPRVPGWMEFGNERLDARPYMSPTAARFAPELPGRVSAELAREAEGAGA